MYNRGLRFTSYIHCNQNLQWLLYYCTDTYSTSFCAPRTCQTWHVDMHTNIWPILTRHGNRSIIIMISFQIQEGTNGCYNYDTLVLLDKTIYLNYILRRRVNGSSFTSSLNSNHLTRVSWLSSHHWFLSHCSWPVRYSPLQVLVNEGVRAGYSRMRPAAARASRLRDLFY